MFRARVYENWRSIRRRWSCFNLKTEMAEGESAGVIGPTRLPASRVASPFRCNRCEPGSLVEPSTTPSSSLSIPVSRFKQNCSRFFGAAEVDLSRRQLETSVFICPGAANGPSPPLALPNQRPHLFLKCSRGRLRAGVRGDRWWRRRWRGTGWRRLLLFWFWFFRRWLRVRIV